MIIKTLFLEGPLTAWTWKYRPIENFLLVTHIVKIGRREGGCIVENFNLYSEIEFFTNLNVLRDNKKL
jgi:hypothetical protein